MNTDTAQNNRLKQAYDFLSSINKEAYKDIFLLSNQILSKNPLTSDFLTLYFKKEFPKAPSLPRVFSKIFKYYFYSLKNFVSYSVEFLLFRFSGLKFTYSLNEKEIVIIATFFIIRKIKEENSYADPYFPGIDSILEKLKRHYAYLPFFDGPRKCYRFNDFARILEKSKKPILYEFQLLKIMDLLRLFYFILTYPFHLLCFFRSLKSDNYELRLLKAELLNTLDQVTFYAFSRYLQGIRIEALPYEKIKVISWYENQVIDKNLYRGLRVKQRNKVDIYGAQLLLYSRNLLNIIPDENEAAFGMAPDKILVNGSFFIPENSKLNYGVGPSMRYSRLFKCSPKKEDRADILVLLPYFINDAENILKLMLGARFIAERICIKAHPAIGIARFKHLLPRGVKIVNEDIYKLFLTTEIMIGAASGTLIEAASLGIPVVYVKNPNRFDFNPLPDHGRGLIWEEADNPEELSSQVRRLQCLLKNNYSDILKISSDYKQSFFCEPTDERIIESFHLDSFLKQGCQ